jgi:hypothetical protein
MLSGKQGAAMYVLRWEDPEEDTLRHLAFASINDARDRFTAAALNVHDGDYLTADLFEVAGEDDARRAVATVQSGGGKLIDIDWKRKLEWGTRESVAKVVKRLKKKEKS